MPYQLGFAACHLDSDLTKAYLGGGGYRNYTVDRAWLRLVASRFGFSAIGVVHWLEILMAGSTSNVQINGFLSSPFPSSNGLPQGRSLSCYAWIIAF